MVTIPLAPIDAVRITILMDNVTDPLIFPTPHVGAHDLAAPPLTASGRLGRHRWPARRADRPAGLLRARAASRPAAASGPSCSTPASRRPAWSRTCAGSSSRRRRSRRSCSATVTGTTSRAWRASRRSSGRRHLPVLIHPAFWRRRRIAVPGLDPAELPVTSRSALEGAGFAIVEERAAVVPARRVGPGDGRGRAHAAVRDRLPRARGARARSLGGRSADPRRPGHRDAPRRPRADRAHRMRARRHHQRRAARPAAHRRGRRSPP